MEQQEQEPFDREAWRRLLGADTGAPTKEIDRRILAEARRMLAPRIGRWWLPASLAASLLLAVLIVQWQLADVGTPAQVTESDVPATAPAGTVADSAAAAEMEQAAPRQKAPAPTGASMPPRVDLPALESRSVPSEAPPAAAPSAPSPAAESAISAIEERSVLRNQGKTAEAKSAGMFGASKAKDLDAESRTPEQWYADIEALRAAGRIKEADAELARLKTKYPGWLESHHKRDP